MAMDQPDNRPGIDSPSPAPDWGSLHKYGVSSDPVEANFRMPTPQERASALEKQLSVGISDLVPDSEKKILSELRGGALNADVRPIQAALNSLKDDTKLLGAMTRELNSEFARLGKDVRFDLTDDNKLLLSVNKYEGVVITPKTVESHAVTGGYDGETHLSRSGGDVGNVNDVMNCIQATLLNPRTHYRSYNSDPYYDLPSQRWPLHHSRAFYDHVAPAFGDNQR